MRGSVTSEEARQLVNARNALLVRMRSKLTPFGELYSEILKPNRHSSRSRSSCRAKAASKPF